MKRAAENNLRQWYRGRNRHPLVIRGARQVGKSTLVRDFAAAEGLVLNEVNLYQHLYLAPAFRSLDPKRICHELGGVVSRNVCNPGSLLFLDEIQAVPEAIDALRYLYEEMPQLAVVAAGSLLEFALSRHSFSMPVGRVQYMFLGPATFFEFVAAQDEYLAGLLRSGDFPKSVPNTAHARLMTLLRRYMLVGGMPEAAQSWIDTGDMALVSAVHSRIVDNYVDDFSKYAGGADLVLMQRVLTSVPNHVGEKVKFVNYSREHKAAKISDIIELFTKARIVCQVTHTDANGIPLGAEERPDVRKLLFLDIGLMNKVNGLEWRDIEGLDDIRLVNEGKMAEQFVGQHLFFRRGAFEKPRLHYWLREGAKANAEVDYVVENGLEPLPVEVKAGASGSMKALRQMVLDKKLRRAVRFDASPASRQTVVINGGEASYELFSLPLYAAALPVRDIVDRMAATT